MINELTDNTIIGETEGISSFVKIQFKQYKAYTPVRRSKVDLYSIYKDQVLAACPDHMIEVSELEYYRLKHKAWQWDNKSNY